MKQHTGLLGLLLVLILLVTATVAIVTAEGQEDGERLVAYSVPDVKASTTGTGGELGGSIVLLYTNDVHGSIEGYAAVAALRDYYEAAGADVLLLDAGDYIQGDPAVSLTQGETALEFMNAVGYDAAAVGDHEFDYGYDTLTGLSQRASFPLLAANILQNGQTVFPPYTTFQCENGLKVGVMGLTTPESAETSHPEKVKGLTFLKEDALYSCAQKQVDSMKAEGCNIIVCLGHLGIDGEALGNRSVDLLEEVKGIHVFIDGHSHSTLADIQKATNHNCTVNGALLVSSGSKLKNIGVVIIGPSGSTKASNIPVSSISTTMGITPDKALETQAVAVRRAVEEAYNVVIAETKVALTGDQTPGSRTQETNLGDLICDAMLWQGSRLEGQVDAAVMNGGGIRSGIPIGKLTRNDLYNAVPFSNTLYVVKLTGTRLLEALEASTASAPDPLGAFPQVAGIEMVLNTGVPYQLGRQYPSSTYYAPERVNRVSILSVGGEVFSPDRLYTVVTNDFLGKGGDTYYAFRTAFSGYDTGVSLDTVLEDYITDELDGVITANPYQNPQNRIHAISYNDVHAWNWYNGAVNYVTLAGLMDGTGKGFAPTAEVNRATLVTVLYRMAGSPEVSGQLKFPDVKTGKWYSDPILWATNTGLTTGMKNGGFAPLEPLSREQLATFLYRFAQMQGRNVQITGRDVLSVFPDAKTMHGYAETPIRWAVEKGFISGEKYGDLQPRGTATRAQLATILMRYQTAG